ncbi:MAG: PorT family protein [Bacteroidetes bacterium]|nr:PorT family protein [Bacteroidota bacterium]
MKKVVALLIFIAPIFQVKCQVSAGPKFLLNFSNVIGGGNSAGNNFKLGFSSGVYLKFEVSDQISIQPEIVYATRGYKYLSAIGNKDTILKHNLSYIDFPLLLSISIGDKGFINFGPQVGYLINDKMKGTVTSSATSENIDSSNVYGYNTTEYALAFGGGYRFPFKLVVSVQGAFGLTKLFASDEPSHNFVFGISVAYSFGDSGSGGGNGIIYRRL